MVFGVCLFGRLFVGLFGVVVALPEVCFVSWTCGLLGGDFCLFSRRRFGLVFTVVSLFALVGFWVSGCFMCLCLIDDLVWVFVDCVGGFVVLLALCYLIDWCLTWFAVWCLIVFVCFGWFGCVGFVCAGISVWLLFLCCLVLGLWLTVNLVGMIWGLGCLVVFGGCFDGW